MAFATELASVGQFTRDLIPSISETDLSDGIVEARLQQTRVYAEGIRMFHNVDWNTYMTNAHMDMQTRTPPGNIVPATSGLADFSSWYSARFFDLDTVMRQGADVASAAHTPTSGNFLTGVFSFASPPSVELYLTGLCYNPYKAAAMCLALGHDQGGRTLQSISRGAVSYSYADPSAQIKTLQTMGYKVNRRIMRIERA